MLVLGIETSCDETAVALYDSEAGLLAHQLRTQMAMHAEYGGVVPELASRDHIRYTLPLLKDALRAAGKQLTDINGIAYTQGPGLVGALLVGVSIGRSLGLGLGVPTVGVHHMEAHLLAPLLETPAPAFPFLALLVSGGHTLLVRVMGLGKYEILGESLDDAVGEAFDKTAKLLGLSYPGGPAIEKLASQGNAQQFSFPRPMTDRPGLDFSFSGLKTHAVHAWRQSDQTETTKADLCAAFQTAVVDTLAIKCQRALIQTGLERLVVAGGVGANRALRKRLDELGVQTFYPRFEFCTDNAAMVAFTGYLRLAGGQRDKLEIKALPRWPMANLSTDFI